MGETQIVEVPYEETGSVSPEQQASEAQAAGETAEVSDRPDYLPEKFNTPEEMAKAYQELEGKLGTPTAEAPEIEGAISDNDMQFYSDRFAENGQLEEADYVGLEAKGISKGMVDNYIAGQQAMVTQHTQNVFNQVGGEEQYTAMTKWASETFSAEEVAVFDAAVNSGDMNQTMSAVKGLQARHQMEHGTRPTLMQGKTGGSGVTAYASLAEMKRDMRNPKYDQDPAFRESVKNKLANSNIM